MAPKKDHSKIIAKKVAQQHAKTQQAEKEKDAAEKKVGNLPLTLQAKLNVQVEREKEDDLTRSKTAANEQEEADLREAEGRNFICTVWFSKAWATTDWQEPG